MAREGCSQNSQPSPEQPEEERSALSLSLCPPQSPARAFTGPTQQNAGQRDMEDTFRSGQSFGHRVRWIMVENGEGTKEDGERTAQHYCISFTIEDTGTSTK